LFTLVLSKSPSKVDIPVRPYGLYLGSWNKNVTTDPATGIEAAAATGNGNITDNGGEDCDKRGFVYDTSPHGDPGDTAPADSEYSNYVEETDSFGTGAFTGALTGLEPKTTYYLRAYAHNSAGYSYGNGEGEFTTGGHYNLVIKNINLPYEDRDKTKELHVVLKNLSPTPKEAGTDGELKVKIDYEPAA